MGSVTVLLSAMGLSDTSILRKLSITGNSIIIDQCDEEKREYRDKEKCLLIKTRERGLSKSRNMAIREAAALNAERCIFCDNDVLYEDNYEEIIGNAFDRNPDSDILVFFVERPERKEPVLKKEGPLTRLMSMKIFSPEIAFRLSSIKEKNLKMDELFGAGAKYGMGEENIFLFDAVRAGLKVTYVPRRIAGTIENESTWFKGYTEEFFINRGAGYYRMSRLMYPFLSLQFALRKRGLYKDSISTPAALKAMEKGRKEYKREKRYFLAGDTYSGTGPANATAALLAAMPSNTLYLKNKSKALRAVEIIGKIRKSDAVIFSGHSRQNILGMKCAKKAGVFSVYIMHGAVEYENRINKVENKDMAADEREMMERADLILAVSKTFEEWLKENYPEYKEKISHLTNGIDRTEFYVNHTGEKPAREDNVLLSVGGGMPRKRIKELAEAVKILNERDGMDLILKVAGDTGADSGEIDSYSAVQNLGLLGTEEMKELYLSSRLFIQNSIFETFGLAPLEALLCGCDIMVSRNCGVLEVFREYEDTDVIEDPEDIEEIAEKIKHNLSSGNNERLLKAIDLTGNSWEKRAEELCRIIEERKR